MKNLDYYTVMESRINYFSRKYDPQNKLGGANAFVIKARQEKDFSSKTVKKPNAGKKILKKLDSVIAMFL
jgi:hypothetical protein